MNIRLPAPIPIPTTGSARFFDTALHRDRDEHLADPYLQWNRHFTFASHWMVCHSAREPGSSTVARLDAGVHQEQVLPLMETWQARGGAVVLDERPTGGHTSDYATASVLAVTGEGHDSV